MSDQLIYDIAADLTDFLTVAVDEIELAEGCERPARIFTAAGRPPVWPECPEIQVWVSAIGSANVPNQDTGVGSVVCAAATYVELTWRLTHCITVSEDGKTPITTTAHETDAVCFHSLAWGLYRRVMARMGSIFIGIPLCSNAQSVGRFEVGDRGGGMVSASGVIRVQVELLDPYAETGSS